MSVYNHIMACGSCGIILSFTAYIYNEMGSNLVTFVASNGNALEYLKFNDVTVRLRSIFRNVTEIIYLIFSIFSTSLNVNGKTWNIWKCPVKFRPKKFIVWQSDEWHPHPSRPVFASLICIMHLHSSKQYKYICYINIKFSYMKKWIAIQKEKELINKAIKKSCWYMLFCALSQCLLSIQRRQASQRNDEFLDFEKTAVRVVTKFK